MAAGHCLNLCDSLGSAVESGPYAQSSSPTTEAFQSLADLLLYISSDWDRLTRSLDCATYPDSKVEGGQRLFPARAQSLAPWMKYERNVPFESSI